MTDPYGTQSLLIALYGQNLGQATNLRLQSLLDRFEPRIPSPPSRGVTERDAILITYADQVRRPGALPLPTLADWCEQYLRGVVSTIHILPFYPSSSDDGFAVMDYRSVDPSLGDWNDIARMGQSFRLMFDAVVNHTSAQSEWFRGFLRDDPRYQDYFIVVPDGADVSRVARPRTLPLLTRFGTPSGQKAVWTTFSADQVDLNYRNPEVLLEVIETLLLYVSRGAEFIRLDAIAYLWKEVGTACIHLPQTHQIVQLFRAILDAVAPHVMLVTETNVPHAENISYWGDGAPESQLVYNFALAPLVLHAFLTECAESLSAWAANLVFPSDHVTFLNFLASHDGIGLNPARGSLNDGEIDRLVDRVEAHGGAVSYQQGVGGESIPYELNVNYFDALSASPSGEALNVQVDRFMTAQAIMLSLPGVPGIYFHSLFGSRGWTEGTRLTGRLRAVNREKLDRAAIERELSDPSSRRHQVWERYKRLLQIRAAHSAFHPCSAQRVLNCGAAIFAELRRSSRTGEQILCLHNVSSRAQSVAGDALPLTVVAPIQWRDLITGQRFDAGPSGRLCLVPYQTLWLTPSEDL